MRNARKTSEPQVWKCDPTAALTQPPRDPAAITARKNHFHVFKTSLVFNLSDFSSFGGTKARTQRRQTYVPEAYA